MTLAFSFSGSIQEEGQQDPPKWKCLKGLMGSPIQAIASLVKQSEPSKDETGGLKMGKSSLFGTLPFSMPLHLLRLLPILLLHFPFG